MACGLKTEKNSCAFIESFNVKKRWKNSNKASILEYNRMFREKTKERQRLNHIQWKEKNRNRWREIRYRKARLLKKAIGKFSRDDWEDLKAFYKFECLACRKREPEIKLTIDHVVPVLHGGTNSRENIQPLCFSCNAKKWIRHVDFRNVNSNESLANTE